MSANFSKNNRQFFVQSPMQVVRVQLNHDDIIHFFEDYQFDKSSDYIKTAQFLLENLAHPQYSTKFGFARLDLSKQSDEAFFCYISKKPESNFDAQKFIDIFVSSMELVFENKSSWVERGFSSGWLIDVDKLNTKIQNILNVMAARNHLDCALPIQDEIGSNPRPKSKM